MLSELTDKIEEYFDYIVGIEDTIKSGLDSIMSIGGKIKK